MIDNPRWFAARKSLGQNFLVDDNVARKLVKCIDPKPGELIVEIGPGFGILTRHLLPSGCIYIGIEIDARLVEVLQKQFGGAGNFRVIHADFLQVELAALRAERGDTGPMRLVGNIPYHITSSIILRALEYRTLLHDMILMVQREVAERIVAGPGSKQFGMLSVLSQSYAHVQLLFHVSRHVFVPRPEVASSVVRWDFTQPCETAPEDLAFFRDTVKKLFGQRRKTLRRSLKQFDGGETAAIAAGIDLTRRIEQLSIEEIHRLIQALYRLFRDNTSSDTHADG